jgi:hypothetical protein
MVGYPAISSTVSILGLDLEAGVEQPLDDDFSRVFRIQDFGREVGAAEEIGQHVGSRKDCWKSD